MERFQITDTGMQKQLLAVSLFLLAFLLAGQLSSAYMAQEYKTAMAAHDSALAGYLLQSGNAGGGSIAAVFTSEKTQAEQETGAALLSSYGYDADMQTSLLPEVMEFRLRSALIILAYSLIFSLGILFVLHRGGRRRDEELDFAAQTLRRFMDGDSGLRLPDCGEGSLSRLFAEINALATSLTAHIQRERESRRFLKETISDISHQLKTPLSALMMYNEILREEETERETAAAFTEKSRRELERMEHLIQSLLKLAKLDAGTIELNQEVHPLKSFLEGCLESFFQRAEHEGKHLLLSCGDCAKLAFDELWLGEAVGNLIKNALDHTDFGGRIELSCGETAAAVTITVRDDGAGIHPEDLHHIFKRFYRSRFSKDSSGVGIGLSLAKAIAEKHGGVLTVQSELGRGAEFAMLFPRL